MDMRNVKAMACFGIAILVFLLCVSPCALAAYERISPVLSQDPLATSIFRLENGLTVYITENHEMPRFYAEIAVRAGSKNDPPETTGLAHYFEHLMFKGTARMGTLDYTKEKPLLDKIEALYEAHFKEEDPEKRKALYAEIDKTAQQAAAYAVPNEMDRVYDAMGARDLNAHTWLEETVYKVDLPSNRFAQWAAVESDRFTHPVFRLFPTELEVVYEEKNRSMDNKQRVIGEAVNALLYKKHPYGQETTLGRPEHLKRPSIRNIRNFFETWYAPNNMAICISGDVETQEVIKTIDQYFTPMPSHPVPEQKEWVEPPLQGREAVSVNFEGEPFVLLAFRTAKNKHADADALLLVDMILDNATAGLINLNLNQQQQVRNAGSYPMQLNDYGAQYLYGVPKQGQSLEEVEQLLLAQLDLIKQGKFEDWIIPAIINDFKKTEKEGLETNSARVAMMRRAFLAYEPWAHAVSQIARMEKLTKEDVVRVANQYFGDDYVVGFRKDAPHEVEHVEKPAITVVEIDPKRQSVFAKEVLKMPYTPLQPVFVEPGKDYSKVAFDNGAQLYHVANPINDLFSFSFSVNLGTYADNGIAIATQLLEKSGAGDLSAMELKKKWYTLGTDFGVGATDNETTITLSGLDENFATSLALLKSLLSEPVAPEETLDKLKEIILVQREDARKQTETIANALVQYNRYGSDSYFLRMLPAAQVRALTVDALQAKTKALPTYKHTFTYTGSLPIEQVRSLLQQYFPVTDELRDPPPYHHKKVRSPEQNEVYFFQKEDAQAYVRLEFGSEPYDEAMFPAIQLYNNYFAGGMAGIVFQELREARALAYVAAAQYITGYRAGDQNWMVGVIQTQPDKAAAAMEAYIELLDTLPESQARFEAAQRAILNRYRTSKIGFRDLINAVRAWERHELPIDPRKARYTATQSAQLEDVLAFQKKYLANRAKLISIVGNQARMDISSLEKTGSFNKLGISDIFID